MRSIEASRIYIIVFSKNYASSSWCLDELVKIMECRRTTGQTAYPVFFNVEPTEVRHQSGAVKEAFAKHEKDEAAGKWRNAMKEAADLAGRELKTTFDGYEAKFIQKVVDVTSVYEGRVMMKKMMSSRKVLVVLDDVDDIEQLEALAGEPTWFKPGSTIIITTRDEEVLVAHGVKFIHDVNLLSNKEGIRLFSRYAFGREIPIEGYEELTRKVVHYAAGLPLTIKVLGSSLCGKTDCEWNDAIERLKKIPEKKTLKTLELSYDGLEHDHKEVFLEVACILKGESKDKAIRILESCGFQARFALKVLEQKSLITVSYYTGYLCMHDRIEEMGRNIVRRLHPTKPNKHSRLWIREEIEDILLKDLGTKETLSIKLMSTKLPLDMLMKGLRKMTKLRVLYLSGHCWYSETNPANKLEMSCSNISQVWAVGDKKVLNELKYLGLNHSGLRTFDLGMTPQLETLYLKGCDNLVELNIPVESSKLKSLVLSSSKLSKLDLGLTPQLKEIDLNGCYNLVEFHMPVESPKLNSFCLCYSILSKLDLRLTPQLETISLVKCDNLVELHMPVESPKLNSFYLYGSKLSKLHMGLTPQLEKLDLVQCNKLVELHMPVESPKLISFVLSGSKLSKLDLGLTPQLEIIDLKECNNLVELHMPVESPKLNSYFLSGSKLRKLDLGLTPQLERLDLQKCYYLQEIYAPMGCLEKLANEHFMGSNWYELPRIGSLKLTVESLDKCPRHPNNNLRKLQFKCSYDEPLPLTSGNIEKLLSFGLCACTNLESVSSSISGLQLLGKLKLKSRIPEVPKDLYQLESLQELTLCMKEIKHLPDRICMLKHLKYLQLKSCWLLEQLPMDICRLECLEELFLTDCLSLREIPNNIYQMKCLEYLHIPYCILVNKLPEELGHLKCLKELNIEGTGISRLPQSIFELKGLRIIGSRWRLESYGFTSLSTVYSNKDSCYVKL